MRVCVHARVYVCVRVHVCVRVCTCCGEYETTHPISPHSKIA